MIAVRSRFVFLGTGSYDDQEPLQANIPGLENFQGPVIHPQFWPLGLDYTNKRSVVIGSGATAITLRPALSTSAAHVTMVQRSPAGKLEAIVARLLPRSVAHQIIRRGSNDCGFVPMGPFMPHFGVQNQAFISVRLT